MANRKPLSLDIICGMPSGARAGATIVAHFSAAQCKQPLAAHAILIMRNSQTCTRNDGACPASGRARGGNHLNYASASHCHCNCIQCDRCRPTVTAVAIISYNTINGSKISTILQATLTADCCWPISVYICALHIHTNGARARCIPHTTN